INSLPGGTLNISAYYPGDGHFAPSTSPNALLLTVTPENSTTSIEAIDQDQNPFSTGPYGSFVYIRADVKSQSGHGVPTGTVNFTDSQSISPGSYALNSQGNTGVLNLATVYSVGLHAMKASYFGDASFHSSVSGTANFTITQAS